MISNENRIIVSNDFSNQKGFNIVFGMYFFIVIQELMNDINLVFLKFPVKCIL